ncbi:MAG: hypothetical protein ABI590_00230 [Ilumatobacteraceae bacterium]
MPIIQYRVRFAKDDEVVQGPDGADVVLSCNSQDATTDPTVAYMQGRLKVVGSSAALFEVLASGGAAKTLSALASRS